jgi:hypothetical protein
MGEHNRLRRPSQKVVDAIAEGLDEIDSYVPFPRRSTAETETVTESLEDEGNAQDDDAGEEYGEDDDGDYRTDYFDREEIEVAIDAFLSALVAAGVIKKGRHGKLPSFSEVFAKFFGQDHEVTKKANSFEDFIKGYFGWISPEDLRKAHEEFLEIYEIVKESAQPASNAQ